MKKVVLLAVLHLPLGLALLQYQRLSNHGLIPMTTTTTAKNTLHMRLNPTSFEGTSYTITEFPRPALRRLPNVHVEEFEEDFQKKTKEMMIVMYAAKGVGLAAPQIGLNENFFVYNPSGDPKAKNMERVVCNPLITEYSDAIEVEEEGCLSLRSDYCPGLVARSFWIQAEYQNELGQQIKRRLKGFEARVFQHEYDHLKGILCWDRFPPEDREAVQSNIDKLLGLYTADDAIVEPNASVELRPPALTVRQMPPLDEPKEAAVKKVKTVATAKSGFGGPTINVVGGKKGGSKKKKKKK